MFSANNDLIGVFLLLSGSYDSKNTPVGQIDAEEMAEAGFL